MPFQKVIVLCLAFGLSATNASAVELRLKHQKDQVQSSRVDVRMEGNLEVEGSQRLSGKAKGNTEVLMNQKTLDVDDKGVANIEFRLDGWKAKVNSEADWGQGKSTYEVNLDENGGTMLSNGKEEKLPPMGDVKAQSWQVKLDSLGAPAGFNLDTAQMGKEEAEEVKKIGDSVASLVSQAPPLPSKDVNVGDKWETVFSVKNLTASLSKDNPMLAPFADLGIEDVKTESTLKEIRKEGQKEIAAINSTTNFGWKQGNLPLGPVSITVNNLDVKSESITELNQTDGVIQRANSVTTLEFDLAINTVLGPEGPGTFNAKGSLRLDSTTSLR
jgi:hypothetical protein